MSQSKKVEMTDRGLSVPNNVRIPFIEGDGIGADIWAAASNVFDSAVIKAYNGEKSIEWVEVLAGEKAFNSNGEWLPNETLDTILDHKIAIKGPLTTPIGGGIRSLNVALRQKLDLYACVRPVRWFTGVPSPVKEPQKVDMVIFRENTEDIYAGIEWMHGSKGIEKVKKFLIEDLDVQNIRFPDTTSLGVKPVSKEGTERLVKSAIDYAIEQKRDSVTLVHKGNIMKFTEGAFRDWGYELAREGYGSKDLDGGPWQIIKKDGHELIIKDVIADAFLQEILINPKDHDVVATLNLNGDYISDALAAQVGGIGISPGANLSDKTAIFEATHGTAPVIAGKNIANPSSLILSAHMMLEYMGWDEAADIIMSSFVKTLSEHKVTADFANQIPGCKPLTTKEFAKSLITNI